MKKIMITAMLVSFAVMTQAQFYLGGELGFGINGGKNKPKDGDEVQHPRTTNFSIAPIGAYQFSEKLAIGGRVNFGLTRANNNVGEDGDNLRTETRFSVGVFAQYTCLQVGKFLFLAEGDLGFSLAGGKHKIGSTSTDLAKTNTLALRVTPIIAFDLNDKVRLFSRFNFLSLGISRTSTNQGFSDPDDRRINNHFGLGLNANEITRIGNITIGFLYKF